MTKVLRLFKVWLTFQNWNSYVHLDGNADRGVYRGGGDHLDSFKQS